MIDTWCTKRDTEKNISHASRTLAVNAFLRYMNGWGEGPFESILYMVKLRSRQNRSYLIMRRLKTFSEPLTN